MLNKKNHLQMKWIEINNFYFRYMRYISDTSIAFFCGIKIQISIFAVYTEASSCYINV